MCFDALLDTDNGLFVVQQRHAETQGTQFELRKNKNIKRLERKVRGRSAQNLVSVVLLNYDALERLEYLPFTY